MWSGTLIVGGASPYGDSAFYAGLVREAGHVVAVDSGTALVLACERLPDLVVGDLDSIDEETLRVVLDQRIPLDRHPSVKDVTDLDLALAAVRASCRGPVGLTACFGGRFDHSLASLGSIARFIDLGPHVYEPDMTMRFLDADHQAELTLTHDQATISLFALFGPATVSLTGVAYPLERHVLAPLSSLGVSNITTADETHIRVTEGTLVVIHPFMAAISGADTRGVVGRD